MVVNVLKLTPALKSNIWGGTKLKTDYNIETDLDIVSEAWLLSVHPDGKSILDNGKTLDDYIKENPDSIGKNGDKFERFPILIKLIDARDNLSVQVHPDDSFAMEYEGEYGKTEMWYVCDCEENSYLYYGLNKTVSKEQFEDAIKNNTVTEILNRVKVKKGDLFFIPSGTIHAIGSGIVICEIQQNSNTTYRVYDYDRRDKNGNARELHIEKALEVSNLNKIENDGNLPETEKFNGYTKTFLGGCEYFASEKLEIETSAMLTVTDESFKCLTVIEGDCEVMGIKAKKGESLFIPSANKSKTYEIKGKCTVILSYIP